MESGSAGTCSQARAWYEVLVWRRSPADLDTGSIQTCCSHRRSLHSSEGKHYAIPSIRASHLQATMPSRAESFRVSVLRLSYGTLLTPSGMSIFERGYGSVRSVCNETPYHHITKTYPRLPYLPNSIPRTRRSNTNLPDQRPPPRFSYIVLIHARRRTAFKR